MFYEIIDDQNRFCGLKYDNRPNPDPNYIPQSHTLSAKYILEQMRQMEMTKWVTLEDKVKNDNI